MLRKRIIPFLLLSILIFLITTITSVAKKTTTEEPIYEARAKVLVSMRKEIGSSRKIGDPIERNVHIRVYDYKDGWCKVKYNGKTGWIDEQYLWAFRPLQSEIYSVPHQHTNTGLLTLKSDVNIQTEDFSGRVYTKGDAFCINTTDETSVAYVWRNTFDIAISDHDYTPFVSWTEAHAGDIISGFSTFYTEDQGAPYQKNRELNLELSCKRLNNTVIPSYGRFSFNDLCGPYTRINGYQTAPSIGGSGKGPGGGVCQVSTTMFNAILGLPIDIKEWTLHSQAGVPYVPLSFDASTGPNLDFVFVSRLDYPVRVRAEAKNGVVTILLICEKEINDDN